MSTQLQLRRGPAATVISTTGAAGELLVDTDNWTLYLQDGITPGGHIVGATTNPAGSNTQIQYNNSGAFGASSNLTYDSATNTLIAGKIKFDPVTYSAPTITTTDSVNDMIIVGYVGDNTHPGRSIQMYGGDGQTPGFVSISGGNSSVAATGGNVTINSGGGTTTSGNITIDSSNTGDAGDIILSAGFTLTVSGLGPLLINGAYGSPGDVLTSQGAGLPPLWTTPAGGTVTSVTATSPLSSTGGATPDISISQATTSTDGYLSSTDWNTFNNKGSGTVTSVAALTLGTTGTDLSSTVANGTTTPVITLNVPTASATNRGALSSSDWTTFNSKAASGANSNITSLSGITGAITTPTYIDFATGATVTPAVGRLTWDATDGTLQFGLAGGNVNLQIGQEQVVYVLNKSGGNYTNGQVVYINGAQGNRPTVLLAKADSEATSKGTIGFLTENINNNAQGFVTTSGIVRGVDTSAFTDGDVLYLSATTAGGYTNVPPAAPNHLVVLGYVVRAHATVGEIYVKVDNGYELNELHNVLITSPTNGQLLTYNSTSSVWENANPAYTGTVTSVGGTGSVNGITLTGTVTSSGNLTLGGALTPQTQASSVATSTTINWANKDVTTLTLTGNTAITNSGAVNGQKMILQLVQGGSGSYTVTFTSETQFGTSFTSITLSTTVGKMDMIGLVYSTVNNKYNIVSFAAGY